MKWLNKLLIFLLISVSVQAGESIGVVALTEGKVWKVRKGKKSILQQNEQILEKDEIITGEDAFVKILMNDDTVFDFGEATKFSFEKFKMKSKADRKADYNFSYGKMRSIFTIKAKDEESLKIKTPDIVMGVRGTEILADVYKSGKTLKTNVSLLSGKLNISGFTKNIKKTFDIKPGFVFDSSKFKKFNKPNKFLNNLSKTQFNALRNTAKMTRGSFLFDKISGKKSFPINNEMKKILDLDVDKVKVFQDQKSPEKTMDQNKKGPTMDPNSQKGLRDKFKDHVLKKFKKPPKRAERPTYNRINKDGPSKSFPEERIKSNHFNNSPFKPAPPSGSNVEQ